MSKRDKALDRLHNAVAHYIKSAGGSVVMTGPVQVQWWPEDNKHGFTLAIKCLGKPPVKATP